MTYDKLIKNQFRENKHACMQQVSRIFQCIHASSSSLVIQHVLVIFFKKISAFVMKFMGIKSIMQMESEQNQEDYYQACKTLFKQMYSSSRNLNDYRACKEYLETKPEWSSFSKIINVKMTMDV